MSKCLFSTFCVLGETRDTAQPVTIPEFKENSLRLKGNEVKRKVVKDLYHGPARDHSDLWEIPLGRGKG